MLDPAQWTGVLILLGGIEQLASKDPVKLFVLLEFCYRPLRKPDITRFFAFIELHRCVQASIYEIFHGFYVSSFAIAREIISRTRGYM